MRRPASVRNGDLRDKSLVHIDGRFCDLFSQANNLADLFEVDDLAWFVAVNAETSRVVAAVFFTLETADKDLEDFLSGLLVVLADEERAFAAGSLPFLSGSCSRQRYHTLWFYERINASKWAVRS